MTRVATPANESVLVSVARHGTAAHVEKLVRKYRWTQRRDAAKLAQLQHEQRNVSYFFDDGRYVHLERPLTARDRRGRPQGARAGRRSGASRRRKCFRGNSVADRRRTRGAPMRYGSSRRRFSSIAAKRQERAPRPTAFKSSCTSIRRSSRSSKLRPEDGAAPLRARGRTRARARYGSAACVRRDRRRYRRRRRRRAARHRPQDAQHPAGDQPSAESARRRLPLTPVRSHALHRRAPRQALGQWRRDEARQPRSRSAAFIIGSCTKAAMGSGVPTTDSSFSRGRTAGASSRTARIVSAETFRPRIR